MLELRILLQRRTLRFLRGWCKVARGVACGVRHAFRVTSDPSLYYPGTMGCRQHCASPRLGSGKPYLSQLVPLVALVREQRFAPASAGDASLLLAESRLRRFQRNQPQRFFERRAKSVVFVGGASAREVGLGPLSAELSAASYLAAGKKRGFCPRGNVDAALSAQSRRRFHD